MKKYIILTAWAALLALAYSCTSEKDERGGEKADGAITLSGVIPMAAGDDNNLYLMAVVEDDPSSVYIEPTLVRFNGGLASTPKDAVFPGGTPYYPLGETAIRFYSFTGSLVPGTTLMQLTSGRSSTNDAILSNAGKRDSDPLPVDYTLYEGEGTPGSSKDPAHILEYRHVMSRLNVIVKEDPNNYPGLTEDPVNVQFTIDGLVRDGRYDITSLRPDINDEPAATLATQVGSALYSVRQGINYIVPNGFDLEGAGFRTLTIDNYVATPDDLLGFTISLDNPGGTGRLLPGYAYDLTIYTNNLRVTSVKLELVDWDTTELGGDNPGYTPYELTLDLGRDYVNSGDDAITKVALYTPAGLMYVGGRNDDGTMDFVTLPTTVERVELYTRRGLLISSPAATAYDGASITLPLSVGGMLPVDPTLGVDQDNPLLVTTPVQFLNIGKDTGTYYRQGANIDFDALVNGEQDVVLPGFETMTGIYDGYGYWIANVEVAGIGLFRENRGELRGIRIYSGALDAGGQSYAGGICGQNFGTIVGCVNEMMIRNAEDTAGGIAGVNAAGGFIVACLNTGNIFTGSILGGICGSNLNDSEGAIAACLNTGWLDETADILGGICGQSVNSGANVVRTSFWLVGTAQKVIGGSEVSVGSQNTGLFDTSNMDPEKLRNGLNYGERDPQDRVVTRLNAEIAGERLPWQRYRYVYDNAITGITWPMPIEIPVP